MAKVLWGDPTVGNSSLIPQASSTARRFSFLLACACVHILVQARVRHMFLTLESSRFTLTPCCLQVLACLVRVNPNDSKLQA